MKKIFKILFLLLLLLLIVYPVYYFVSRDGEKFSYEIVSPNIRNINNYIICSGIVLPKEEVDIKSRISGILKYLYVKNGDSVRIGEKIAEIKVIPEMGVLANAQSSVNSTKINLTNQESIFARNKLLYEKGVISRMEFETIENDYLTANEKYNNSIENLKIVKYGFSSSSNPNTIIVSTIDGIITSIPYEVGASVIQTNNFNEGTTIAKVANTQQMIFHGQIKEFDVSKIRVGMPVIISVSINNDDLKGRIVEISTSGKNVNGMILFDIKCSLVSSGLEKTGFSANAKIITDKRDKVLSVKEEWIYFEKDTAKLNIHFNDDKAEMHPIGLGISDGIYTEVISGLDINDKIRVQH